MIQKRRLSKSLRKHIRREKARIRREVLDLKKQEELINEIYQKYFTNHHKIILADSSAQRIKIVKSKKQTTSNPKPAKKPIKNS